jgi:nitronate monooxygenase
MWNQNRLTQLLKLDWPIVQGAFGSGLSSVELASTVSNGGGLGSFGAHYLPPEEIGPLVEEMKRKTARSFAVNLWVSDHDSEAENITLAQFEKFRDRLLPAFEQFEVPLPAFPKSFGQNFEKQIEALLRAAPPVFSFVYGIPAADILAECRRRGIVTMGTAITVEEAMALDEAGVDVIVASGMEAGGHRVSFLKAAEESLVGGLSLIPMVVDRVRKPVVAAGGIADGRGVAAVLTLGASAAQLGTAFLACTESNASAPHKEVLRSRELRPTALTRAFTGRLARGIENRFMHEFGDPGRIAPYPVQAWLTQKFKAAATANRDLDHLALWAGQSFPQVKHTSARELLDSLAMETEQILTGRSKPSA